MAAAQRRVFADVMDVGALIAKTRFHAISALFVIIIIVHTAVAVALPAKLFGNSPILGAIWAGAALLGIGYALIHLLPTIKASIFALPFLALGVWALASVTWTVAPYETTRGAILYGASLLFAIGVAATFDWDRIIALLAWTICGLLGVSVLLAIGAPSIGQMQGELAGAWSGVWPEKQALGFHASLGCIAALAMARRGQTYWPWYLAIGLSIVAIIGSRSTTALVMSAIGLAVYVWFWLFYRGFAGKLIGTWVAFAGALIAVPLSAYIYDMVLQVAGKTDDLSGRREIWESVRALGDMRPDLGWGYQSIWRGKDDLVSPMQWVIQNAQFTPANSHSSWLDTYVQLGAPGVFLLVVCLLWAWAALIIKADVDNRILSFSAACLGAITFISFSETNLAVPMEFQWFLVTLIGVKLYITPAQDYDYDHDRAHDHAQAGQSDMTQPPQAEVGQLDGDTYTY